MRRIKALMGRIGSAFLGGAATGVLIWLVRPQDLQLAIGYGVGFAVGWWCAR